MISPTISERREAMLDGLGRLSNGIWKSQTWSVTIKEVVDGLVYGLLTASTFGWLWPR
jgi:hypothetical protein